MAVAKTLIALALVALAAATSVRGAVEQEALQAADAMLDALVDVDAEKGGKKNPAAEVADRVQAQLEKSAKDLHAKFEAFTKKMQTRVDAAAKRLEAAKAPFEAELKRFAALEEGAKKHISELEAAIAAEEAKLKQLATEKEASIAAAAGDADLIKAAEEVYSEGAAAVNAALEGLKKQLAGEKAHLADAEASAAKLHKDQGAVAAKGHAAAEKVKASMAAHKKTWEDNIKRVENAVAALKHH